MPAHTLEPTNVSARISAPTSTTAITTIGVTPPGNVLTRRPSVRSLARHTNSASASCDSTNRMPELSIVSDSWRSMAWPCAEMSTGSHVCATKIAVETSVMIVTTTANSLPMASSVQPGLEHEIDSIGLVAADRHVLGLGAELLVPRSQGVLARRQPLDAERPVFARHRVVRSREHDEPAVHPWMGVALDRNELRFLPCRVDRRRAFGLRPVPLGVQLRERVDVVGAGIVVVDVERLVHLHGGDVRDVLTVLLVIPHGLRGRCRPL